MLFKNNLFSPNNTLNTKFNLNFIDIIILLINLKLTLLIKTEDLHNYK